MPRASWTRSSGKLSGAEMHWALAVKGLSCYAGQSFFLGCERMNSFGLVACRMILIIWATAFLAGCVSTSDNDTQLIGFKAYMEREDSKIKSFLASRFIQFAQIAADRSFARKIEFSNAQISEPRYSKNLLTQRPTVELCIEAKMKLDRNPLAALATYVQGDSISLYVIINEREENKNYRITENATSLRNKFIECALRNPRPFPELEKLLPSVGIRPSDPNSPKVTDKY